MRGLNNFVTRTGPLSGLTDCRLGRWRHHLLYLINKGLRDLLKIGGAGGGRVVVVVVVVAAVVVHPLLLLVLTIPRR